MRISVFARPVSNTIKHRDVNWPQLFKLLTGPPTVLPDNRPETKARFGDYFTRGLIEGEGRSDDLLKECYVIILDIDHSIDTAPLPTPQEIHAALHPTGAAFAVHTSATPGRCRLVMPVQPYAPSDTDQRTWEAYCWCMELGLKFAFAGESKRKSQPWFLPQTTDPFNHHACGCEEGQFFDATFCPSAPIFKHVQPPPLPAPLPVSASNGSKDHTWFIQQLHSGTLHQAAMSYAGFLRETTKWTPTQILDQITELVDRHAPAALQERWHAGERAGIEKWFAERGFLSGLELAEEGRASAQKIIKHNHNAITAVLAAQCDLDQLRKKVFPPLQWVVNGMLPAGLTIVGGRPKVGKGFFCLDLITAVAKGGAVFGNRSTNRGTTVYISMEDRERRINNRLNELDLRAGGNARVLCECLPINAGLRRVVRGLAQEHRGLSLIIIDTMTHVIPPPPRGTDGYSYYSKNLTSLMHLADELRVSIMLIHHLKKGEEGNAFDKLIGSVGIQGAADTMVIIERAANEAQGTFKISSRDLGDRIWSAAFEDCRWVVEGEKPLDSDNKNDLLIGEVIKASREGLRQKDIIAALHGTVSKDTIKGRLKRLVQGGVLMCVDDIYQLSLKYQ